MAFFISGKQYSNEFQVTRCGSFYNQPRIYRTSTAVKTARALIYASRRHGYNFKTQKIEFYNLPPSNEVHFWSWSTKWKYGGYLSTFLGVKVLTKSHAVHFERPMTWDYSRYGIHIWCRMNRRWYSLKILMRMSTYKMYVQKTICVSVWFQNYQLAIWRTNVEIPYIFRNFVVQISQCERFFFILPDWACRIYEFSNSNTSLHIDICLQRIW